MLLALENPVIINSPRAVRPAMISFPGRNMPCTQLQAEGSPLLQQSELSVADLCVKGLSPAATREAAHVWKHTCPARTMNCSFTPTFPCPVAT